jgi:chromate reductase
MKSTIVTFAGSARRGSLNKKLARGAALVAESLGAEGVFVDLGDYPLPIYDGDLEVSEGIPENARALAELIEDADGLFIASPEYNGAYSALLKNTIDWLSRIDRRMLSKPVAIASASPGSRGGVGGLKQLRAMLVHMHIPVMEDQLSVPAADRALDGVGAAAAATSESLREIVASLVDESRLVTASSSHG